MFLKYCINKKKTSMESNLVTQTLYSSFKARAFGRN